MANNADKQSPLPHHRCWNFSDCAIAKLKNSYFINCLQSVEDVVNYVSRKVAWVKMEVFLFFCKRVSTLKSTLQNKIMFCFFNCLLWNKTKVASYKVATTGVGYADAYTP